MSGKARTKSG